MTYHFPDAYAGTNTKIRDTLNNLILKSPQSWQTSVGLPFFQIQGTVVEWDEVRFDVRLMQRVPYEGISRMQTSLRRRHRDRVVRRGLAMMIGASLPPCSMSASTLTRLPSAAQSRTSTPPTPAASESTQFQFTQCWNSDNLVYRSQALCRPAQVDPVLRAGDLQCVRKVKPP